MTDKQIKLTREDAKVYYITSSEDISLPGLAEHFKGVRGCSLGSIVANSAKENWPELRTQHLVHCQEKALQKAATQGSNDIVKRLGQINQMQEHAFVSALTLDFKSAGEAIASLIKLEEMRRTITGQDINMKLEVKIPGSLYGGLGQL